LKKEFAEGGSKERVYAQFLARRNEDDKTKKKNQGSST